MIQPSVVDPHRWCVGLGCARLKILPEERQQHFFAKLARGVALPLQWPQAPARAIDLAMEPRPHHQKVHVVMRVFGLFRGISVVAAPHILLVPQALFPQHRHGQRNLRNQFIERLPLPELVVRRVLLNLVPERHLIQPAVACKVAGRAKLKEVGVVVVVAPRNATASPARRELVGKVVQARLAEGPVMKPVVAHPAVNHWALRRGHLQRRVRIQQRHHDRKTLVRRSNHPHATVALGHILHQPVNRVPRIIRVVRSIGVQRPRRRRSHYIIALRAVLATHILKNANVAGLHPNVIPHHHLLSQVRRLHHSHPPRRIVRSAGKHDGRLRHPIGNGDHRVKLHPVAHGNHYFALFKIVPIARSSEFCRYVGRHG